MKIIQAYKAQETVPQKAVESITILVDTEIPDYTSIDEYKYQYQIEADAIAAALINSLPGGTLDRLLVKLLEHKATSFKVLS